MQFSMYNYHSLRHDNKIENKLINSGLRLQLNDKRITVSFIDLDLEMFGFCIEWNLFALASCIRFAHSTLPKNSLERR